MHGERGPAKGSQSPELLTVVGSEALDFAPSETDDVDLDFGDDLEAEEAEQQEDDPALRPGDRKSSHSPGISTPSKSARASTAASPAHVVRSPRTSRGQQHRRQSAQQQPPRHQQEAPTQDTAARGKRMLSWQAAMGANTENSSKVGDTSTKATPRKVATHGGRSSGRHREPVHGQSGRAAAADTARRAASMGNDSPPQEKGSTAITSSVKPKNPVANYLRQRLMGGADTQNDTQQDPLPRPALRSCLVRLPTKAAPNHSSEGAAADPHTPATLLPMKSKLVSRNLEDGQLPPSPGAAAKDSQQLKLPPPPPLPMPPAHKGRSQKHQLRHPSGSRSPRQPSHGPPPVKAPKDITQRQQTPKALSLLSEDETLPLRSPVPIVPTMDSGADPPLSQCQVVVDESEDLPLWDQAPVSPSPPRKSRTAVAEAAHSSKANRGQQRPRSRSPRHTVRHRNPSSPPPSHSISKWTPVDATPPAADVALPEPLLQITDDADEAPPWDQAPESPHHGAQHQAPPLAVAEPVFTSDLAAPRRQPLPRSPRHSQPRGGPASLPLFKKDRGPPRHSATQRWVDAHSSVEADRRPLPPMPLPSDHLHGRHREPSHQKPAQQLHHLDQPSGVPQHKCSRSRDGMQPPWPPLHIGMDLNGGSSRRTTAETGWQTLSRPTSARDRAVEPVRDRHQEGWKQDIPQRQTRQWQPHAIPFEPLDPASEFPASCQTPTHAADVKGYPQPRRPMRAEDKRQQPQRPPHAASLGTTDLMHGRPLSRREEEKEMLHHHQWQLPGRPVDGKDRRPTGTRDQAPIEHEEQQWQHSRVTNGYPRGTGNSANRILSRREEEQLRQLSEPNRRLRYDGPTTTGGPSGWHRDEVLPPPPQYHNDFEERAPEYASGRLRQMQWQPEYLDGPHPHGPQHMRDRWEGERLQQQWDEVPQRVDTARQVPERMHIRREAEKLPWPPSAYDDARSYSPTPVQGRQVGGEMLRHQWQPASHSADPHSRQRQRTPSPLSGEWAQRPLRPRPMSDRAPSSRRPELPSEWQPSGLHRGAPDRGAPDRGAPERRRHGKQDLEGTQMQWQQAGLRSYVPSPPPHIWPNAHPDRVADRSDFDSRLHLGRPQSDLVDDRAGGGPPSRAWAAAGAARSRSPAPKRMRGREGGHPSERTTALPLPPPSRIVCAQGWADSRAGAARHPFAKDVPRDLVPPLNKRRRTGNAADFATGVDRGSGIRTDRGPSTRPSAWLQKTPPLPARSAENPGRRHTPATHSGFDRGQKRPRYSDGPPRRSP